MSRYLQLAALFLAGLPAAAAGGQVMFGSDWQEQRFSMFGSNDYELAGDGLGIESRDTVSLMWTSLPESMWTKRSAQWRWQVATSVPATDLRRKGGDDRNLSLYFIFLPEEAALKARNRGVRTLLENPDVRILMYVWGGGHARGEILPTPYLGPRGRTVILRSAGTGSAAESVDLAEDHRRAFGEEPRNLVGIAISSDSDDTGTSVDARIENLRIE